MPGRMVVPEKSKSNAQNAKIVGSGETTLVLSHGYGADQSIWDDVAHDLARRFRVVLFDWDFSGAVDDASQLIHDDPSDYSLYEAFSDDLVSLLDDLHLKSVVFVGHSMAGMIGCVAAVRRPELFRRLVLLGASPRYLNADGYEGGFERSDVESIFTNMESNFTLWARGFARLVVGGQGGGAAEKFGECLLRRMRPEVALAVAKAVFLSDLRETLEQVEVPCSVISGERDPVAPASVARYMERKIKGGATVELLDFDGHFPQLTASKILVDALNMMMMMSDAVDHHSSRCCFSSFDVYLWVINWRCLRKKAGLGVVVLIHQPTYRRWKLVN